MCPHKAIAVIIVLSVLALGAVSALLTSPWGTQRYTIGRTFAGSRRHSRHQWVAPSIGPMQGAGQTERRSTDTDSTDEKKSSSDGSASDQLASMSFQEAATELREEEDRARAERSGGALTDEQVEKFDAKKAEYDSMRDKIRSRAQGLNMEKSEATRKAIEEATSRAMAKEEAQPLDLSAISDETDVDLDQIPDLTEDEREEVESFTKMSIADKFKEEISNVKWPTLGAAVRLAGFMVVIFVVTATYILKVDETLRTIYTDLGLIPIPGTKMDYSDLSLPEGWEKDMDSMGDTVTELVKQSVDEITDAIQQ